MNTAAVLTSEPPARRLNPSVRKVAMPPIPLAQGWLRAYDGAFGPAVDMSQAVPGHAPAKAFLRRFAEAGIAPAASRYGDILGDPALRQAYADELSALYGRTMAAADSAITAGCNQAFFAAIMAVAGPGSSVILPTPWYFNHQMTLEMLGVEARALPTRAEDGFVPDVAAAAALIDETTRAIVLVSPNNPTGAVYPAAAIEAMFELARERGLTLILDETYRDFLAPGTRPHALFERADWGDTLIALYSFSKAHAIPGHRLGAMTAGPAVREEVAKILDCLQICPPRPSQAALALALPETRGWRAERVGEIAARADVFRSVMAAHPRWRVESVGAYFAFVAHPFPGRSAEDVARALAQRFGVLTLPGSFFGPRQDTHLRLAFANVDEGAIAALGERLALADDLFDPGVS